MDKYEELLIEWEIYSDIYSILKSTRFKVNQSIINGLGNSEWLILLKEFVGQLITDPRKDSSGIDVIYQELVDQYSYILDRNAINEEDQLFILLELERKCRELKLNLKLEELEVKRLEMEQLVIRCGERMVASHGTVRSVAKELGISKSTVHRYLIEELSSLDSDLYNKCLDIMECNKEYRHIRGGETTRNKYRKGVTK